MASYTTLHSHIQPHISPTRVKSLFGLLSAGQHNLVVSEHQKIAPGDSVLRSTWDIWFRFPRSCVEFVENHSDTDIRRFSEDIRFWHKIRSLDLCERQRFPPDLRIERLCRTLIPPPATRPPPHLYPGLYSSAFRTIKLEVSHSPFSRQFLLEKRPMVFHPPYTPQSHRHTKCHNPTEYVGWGSHLQLSGMKSQR